MYDRFSSFIKFWSSERNTKIRNIYIVTYAESDYSEENTCDNELFRATILHHRKILNIFTLQLPIYYIQCY